MKRLELWNGDCLELMKKIPYGSIDLVLTDPPYGTTACKWDTVIDFELMWKQLKRITKPNGAICLFGSEPFSSALRMSNIKMFKYDWYWQKEQASNFMQLKNQPGRDTEVVSVFSIKKHVYNPIKIFKGKPSRSGSKNKIQTTNSTGAIPKESGSLYRYPCHILKFNRDRTGLAPTQKPVALLEYLIKTYTLENETVLDFTMGSGSTGVAAKNLNRKFIGIELDDNYFNIAQERIKNS